MRNRQVWRAALIAALMSSPGLHAAEVAGVAVDETAQVGGQPLVLNGAGLRTRFFFKVYVGALYVGQRTHDPLAVIDSDAPRRISLRLMREVDATTFHEALAEGLRKNLTPSELAAIAPQAARLAAIMTGMGKVEAGDVVAIDFSGGGVSIALNGVLRGSIAGKAFGRALLSVWLGDEPADAALKKAMLGA